MNTIKKQQMHETLMILPAIILLFTFLVLPFIVSIRLSLTNQRLVQGPVATKFILFRNYAQIISDENFWQAFWNVIKFAVMVIPIQCGIALIFATLLNKQQVMKGVLRSLFFLPFITPMVIVTVIWKTLYQYPKGIFNLIIQSISGGALGPVEWLGNVSTAMPAIVLLSAWQAYGFQMVIYLGGLQGIPASLYEASEIDGANKIQQFLRLLGQAFKVQTFLLSSSQP